MVPKKEDRVEELDIRSLVDKVFEEIARGGRKSGGMMLRIENGKATLQSFSETPAGMFEELSIINPLSGGLFGSPFEMMAPADFMSADFFYDFQEDVPKKEASRMLAIKNKIEHSQPVELYDGRRAALDIFNKETTLDADLERIVVLHKSARSAIDQVCRSITNNKGKIALPVPSWYFWDKGHSPDSNYAFKYFWAMNEEQLVENFAEAAKDPNVKGVLLTNPSNPMCYSISEKAAREIDRIAVDRNIEVILNDIFRGIQPIGNRDSIARYFTQPFVVEGYSKRFGKMLGLTAVLVPDEIETCRFPDDSEKLACMCGDGIRAAHQYSTEPIQKLLLANNRALRAGLDLTFPDVQLICPSESHSISLLKLPDKSTSKSMLEIDEELSESGVGVIPLQPYIPPGMKMPADKVLRLSITNMNPTGIYLSAQRLGRTLKEIL